MEEESRGAAPALIGLLERERELAALNVAIGAAAGGAARAIVISGDPGLGKTSLVEWTARVAGDQGFNVLHARGGGLERTLGWGVARQLFERSVARATPARRRSLLAGSAALAAPVLGLDHDTRPTAEPNVLRDFRFEHGLYWLVSNLAEGAPVALLIDDVQWCDHATLEWLLYLLRRCDGLPLLVALARRTGEPGTPGELLELIAAEPVTDLISLSPLGPESTASLLAEAYGGAVDVLFSRACHERTGGNPLFVCELAAELAAGGIEPVERSAAAIQMLIPERASRTILLRLMRLSEAAIALARAFAALESGGELQDAADLARLAEPDAVLAHDELVAARVIEPGESLRFVHPLIRDVIYEDIPHARRASMHRRAAELLLRRGADPGRVAAHLLRSVPAGEPWIVAALRQAAEHESARGSPATAIAQLRRALAEPPAPELAGAVMLELGRAELVAGDVRGIETLRSLLSASSRAIDRGQVAILLGRLLLGSGSGAATVEVALSAADELGWENVDLRLQLEALIVNAARSDAKLVPLIPERLRIAREHVGEDSYGSRLIAAQLSWGLTAIAAPVEHVVALARQALDGGRLIAESPNAPDTYLGAIHMLSFADELSDADRLFEQAIALAQRNGSEPAFAAASGFRANAAYLRGRLDEAELLCRDALRVSQDSGALELIAGLATAYLAYVLIARGSMAEAVQTLPADVAALEHAPPTWATETLYAAGLAAAMDGRPEQGAELLLAAGRRALSWGVVNPAWIPWRSEAALALLAAGKQAEGVRLADEELDLARRFGAPRPLGIALRARGLMQSGEAGIAMLRSSVDVLARSPARLEHARALIALGGALRRANARADARGPLSEGLAIADAAGASRLAEQARVELIACGARPRSVMRVGADALTASERRVCELAASGRSNPEIAQLLFVTRATVESHLHSAYRRLGIRSRKELPAALGLDAGRSAS
jgi:DNA-binding CsgD family transcriptional regulator